MAHWNAGMKHRPNTVQENEAVLRELNARSELDNRSLVDLTKFFAKINSENAPDLSTSSDNHLPIYRNKGVAERLYGPIPGFPSGSWWGIRMDCSRAGVHEPFDANVQDGPVGAISVCTSHFNNEEDVDFGDTLTFTGRQYIPGKPTSESLILSLRNQIPVRLVRNYNLSNKFAPKTGCRYDGLYLVAAHWIGVTSSAKYHKFALRRLSRKDSAPWLMPASLSSRHSVPRNSKASEPPTKFRRLTRSLHSSLVSDRAEQGREVSTSCSVSAKRKSRFKNVASQIADNTDERSAVTSTKIFPDDHKIVQESTIVSRRDFKKPTCSVEGTSETGSSAISSSDLSPRYTVRDLERHLKMSAPKLQNTNISIRTDLYDSSHNLQQDAKKGASTTFCRVFKPSGLPRLNYPDTESTCSVDKGDTEHKVEVLRCSDAPIAENFKVSRHHEVCGGNTRQSISGDGGRTVTSTVKTSASGLTCSRMQNIKCPDAKSQPTTASLPGPSLNKFQVNAAEQSILRDEASKQVLRLRDGLRDFEESITHLRKFNLNDNRPVDNVPNSHSLEHSYAVPPYKMIRNCDQTNRVVGKDAEVKSQLLKRSHETINTKERATTNSKKVALVGPISKNRNSEELAGFLKPNKDSKESQVLQDSANSLESLTPDEMLSLIVRKRCHPMAKLLIGSMIGLPSGESVMLQAYDALKSQSVQENNADVHQMKNSASSGQFEVTSKQLTDRSTIGEHIGEGHTNAPRLSQRNLRREPERRTRRGTGLADSSSKITRRRIPARSKYQTTKRAVTNRSSSTGVMRTIITRSESNADSTSDAIHGGGCSGSKRNEISPLTDKQNLNVIKNNVDGLTVKMSIPSRQTSKISLKAKSSDQNAKPRPKNPCSTEVVTSSTSSGNSKKPKRIRKRRRDELANLTIDANVGPKVHGPRTRRLRLMNVITTRKRFSVDPAGEPKSPQKRSKLSTEAKRKPVTDLTKRGRRLKSSAANARRIQIRNSDRKRITSSQRRNTRRTRLTRSTSAITRSVELGSLHSMRRADIKTSRTKHMEKSHFTSSRNNRQFEGKKQSRSHMRDAMTQCAISPEISTDSSSRSNTANAQEPDTSVHRDGHQTPMKIEVIDLVDMKSEDEDDPSPMLDDDNYEDHESSPRNVSGGMSVLTTTSKSYVEEMRRTEENEKRLNFEQCIAYPPDTSLESNKQYVETGGKFIRYVNRTPSAFVPVNAIPDGGLRIARLQSIGFRPIKPSSLSYGSGDYGLNYDHSPEMESSSAVTKRGVNEEYEKYTSEENNVVGYMDEELRYEDIEHEDDFHVMIKDNLASKATAKKGLTKAFPRTSPVIDSTEHSESEDSFYWQPEPIKGQPEKSSKVEPVKKHGFLVMDEDPDLPWHGWRKVVADEQTYFVGW